MITKDGNITWRKMVKLVPQCSVDDINQMYFPYDSYKCVLLFASWNYDGSMVDVNKGHIDTSRYIKNINWNLANIKVTKNTVYYSCCTEPYPDVTITLTLERQPLRHLLQVSVPCLSLALATLAAFLLTPDCPERMTVGVVSILGHIILLQYAPLLSFVGMYIVCQLFYVINI